LQFEEGEDGDDKTTIVPAPTTKSPVKIHVELLTGEDNNKKKAQKEKPARLMSTKRTGSSSSESDSQEEDEDEDEDVAGEADSEYVASNDNKPANGGGADNDDGAKRKHMRINVEPIM
jgi:hypothetical protein